MIRATGSYSMPPDMYSRTLPVVFATTPAGVVPARYFGDCESWVKQKKHRLESPCSNLTGSLLTWVALERSAGMEALPLQCPPSLYRRCAISFTPSAACDLATIIRTLILLPIGPVRYFNGTVVVFAYGTRGVVLGLCITTAPPARSFKQSLCTRKGENL